MKRSKQRSAKVWLKILEDIIVACIAEGQTLDETIDRITKGLQDRDKNLIEAIKLIYKDKARKTNPYTASAPTLAARSEYSKQTNYG